MHFNWAVYDKIHLSINGNPFSNLLLKIHSKVILIQSLCSVSVSVCHQDQIRNTNKSKIHKQRARSGRLSLHHKPYHHDADFIPLWFCSVMWTTIHCLVFVTRTNVRCMVKNADLNHQYKLSLHCWGLIHQQRAGGRGSERKESNEWMRWIVCNCVLSIKRKDLQIIW